jgi:predicted Zn-dependent protease
MLSNFSKTVIFIGISCLTVYITFLYHPVSLKGRLSGLFDKEKISSFASSTYVLLLKDEELDSESTDTNELNSENRPETPQEPIIVDTNVNVPKVEEASKGPYLTLETHHSDMEYDSYKPAISPCVMPMGYKIGKFDQQFNLSREKFFQITRDAIAVWEEAAGTSLFTNDPENGTLTLNLIYDERQATTVSLGYLALEIENTKQAAEDTRAAYEREKAVYLNQSELFNSGALDFQKRYAAYNEKVKAYNEKGGATKEEYDVMMVELDALKKEADTFETRRLELNKDMETINAKVKRYNELIEYVNGLIRRSNTVGSRTFTEGRFSPSINTIDIFQYSDETKLRRVLIHEFGHALGIGHVENVQSIMYSFNSGTSTSLSEEDKQALRESCTSR